MVTGVLSLSNLARALSEIDGISCIGDGTNRLSTPTFISRMTSERTSLLFAENENESEDGLPPKPITVTPTPLPWTPLIILQMLTAVQPLAFEIVFPFVNQMILEIGVVDDPEQVGFYSGLIESIFSIMSFLTVLPMSHLSDVIGRKPVVLGGLSGLALSVACFGMSKSYTSMIVSRCLAGASGGVWAITKVMIAELTDKTNQSRAFQMNVIASRFGQVVGLPLGGILSHPERNFPVFRSKFWHEYPFVLPCFVAAGFTIISVIFASFYLEETLRKKRGTEQGSHGTIPDEGGAYTALSSPQVNKKLSYRGVLTGPVVSILISTITMCFASETVFAVFPLFAFTSIASGGLGMSEAAIGTQMAIRAIFYIGLMPFYSYVETWFETTIRVHRLLMWIWPFSILYIPLLNILAKIHGTDSWVLNIALLGYSLVWSISGFTWLTVAIMVTDASPCPEALSTINVRPSRISTSNTHIINSQGLSQLTISLPQAIAPAFVTSLFAFSIESGIGGGNLIYIILLIITLLGAIHSMTLRQRTSSWR